LSHNAVTVQLAKIVNLAFGIYHPDATAHEPGPATSVVTKALTSPLSKIPSCGARITS
jgi:hypothetical protein